MSKFETTFTKRLSIDSSVLNRRLLSGGDEQNEGNAPEKPNIFRYSYNLGKQRPGRIQRTSSIGGNVTQPIDGNLAKVLLGRRGLPRSLSMEERTMREATAMPENTLKADNHPHLSKQFSMHSDVEQKVEIPNKNVTKEISNVTEENISADNDLSSKDRLKDSLESTSKEIALNNDKQTTERIPRRLHHSDSVPDLRVANRLERENFTGLFTTQVETAQTRPICKLRRAARRLGVSLSSEELYHKQRRNGVCTEIDTAAENRKLLRVLNKRF